MFEQAEIKVGDYVKVADDMATRSAKGVVFLVDEITKTGKVRMSPVLGGRPVLAPTYGLVRTDKPAIVETIDIPEPLFPGALVTVSGRGWKEPAGSLYVVVKVELDGRSRLFPLGGDERGRYWRNIPRDYVTVIDPSRVVINP